MEALRKLMPWNWNLDWKRWLPARWRKDRPVSHAGEYTVDLVLPGLAPENLEVVVEGRDLVVRGGLRVEEEKDEGGVRVHRLRGAAFERRVRLPRDVDGDAIRATLERGILTVRLPRVTGGSEGPRRIEVRKAG